MSGSDALSRAEDLWLAAESLERMLWAQGKPAAVLNVVAEAVVATRELFNELNALGATS